MGSSRSKTLCLSPVDPNLDKDKLTTELDFSGITGFKIIKFTHGTPCAILKFKHVKGKLFMDTYLSDRYQRVNISNLRNSWIRFTKGILQAQDWDHF